MFRPSRLKASSSVTVLPTNVAPAASAAATQEAERAAGSCAESQSGLPPPVRHPSTSIKSLTANVRPSSAPLPVGVRRHLAWETNAPKSAADCVTGTVCTLAGRHRSNRFDDGVRVRHEAEAFLDVPDGGLCAEVRRSRGAAIVNQNAAIAEKIGVGQRGQNALIDINASEKNRLGAEVAQDRVERSVPKTADPILVDLNVMRLLLQFVDYCGSPGILFKHMRPAIWQRIAQSNAGAVGFVEVNLIGRHVGEIGPVAPIDPDYRDAGIA